MLKELAIFTTQKLIQIKQASLYSSVISLIMVALSKSISWWIEKNIDYILIALGSVALAHILGSIVHHKFKKDFDWRKNIIGFCIMLSMVVVVALLMEGLAHITKQQDFIYKYMSMVGRLITIIYPIRSALKNVKIITNGAFPPDALIGKLESFNKTLDISEFKDKDTTGQDPTITENFQNQ